jgi:hypothetical protein
LGAVSRSVALLQTLYIRRLPGSAWEAVEKIMRPQTEEDAAATAEFRRMILSDEAAWARYLKDVARG